MAALILLASLITLLTSRTEAKVRQTDAFMSASDLKDLFKLEQALVDILQRQKSELESGIQSIHEYVEEVEELYKGENCWPPENCSDDVILKKIIGNPIYNYQMLKRLLVNWKNLEESIKKIDTKPALAEMKKVKHRHGGMPTDRDLQGAAKALIRLRSTYKINLDEFSRGNILGLETEAALTTKDSFFLGKFAYMNGHLAEAQKWLELTSLQIAAETRANNDTASKPSVNAEQLEQMMKHVNDKLSSTSSQKEIVANDEDDPANYQLGLIPPKTHDRSKMITDIDYKNFAALCRGLKLLPEARAKRLNCYYDARKDPYFILHPIKVEVHHESPHRIVSFHNVLSEKETDDLVALAHPRMVQASVGHGKEVSEMRVSRNCWIKDFESRLVDKISERVNWITGLQTSRPLDIHGEGKEEEFEHLQIANYGIGGHYDPHQDPMFVYKEPDFVVHSVENKDGNAPYPTGDRLATFMLYLSEVPLGGWTSFPRLGVSVPPSKGSAVYWHNIKASGRSDMAMLHGGCPVVLGSKWVANKWIREVANMFHNKCIDDIDK